MQTGLIVRSDDLSEPLAKFDHFHIMEIWKPDIVVLDLENPHGMQYVEPLSKTGYFFPMISTRNGLSPLLVSEYLKQCFLVLERAELIVKVTSASKNYPEAMFNQLVKDLAGLTRFSIYVASPAAYFFSAGAAHELYAMADKVGVEAHRIFMFSNTETSLSILGDPRYKNALLQAIEKDEKTQLHLQMLTPDTHLLQPLLELQRPVLIHGIADYASFRKSFLVKENTVIHLSKEVIATAKILRDKTSAWNDVTCADMTTRKFKVGDPDVLLVEVTGNVGKTVEGDYVNLRFFDVVRL